MTLSVLFFRIFPYESFKLTAQFSRFCSIANVGCVLPNCCLKLIQIYHLLLLLLLLLLLVFNYHNCSLFHGILSLFHNWNANIHVANFLQNLVPFIKRMTLVRSGTFENSFHINQKALDFWFDQNEILWSQYLMCMKLCVFNILWTCNATVWLSTWSKGDFLHLMKKSEKMNAQT